jgi:hypothetical protein
MVATPRRLMTLGVEFRPQRFEKTLANVVVTDYLFLMRRHRGIFVRTVLNPHSTWLVNSAIHMWGSRRFFTTDTRNRTTIVMPILNPRDTVCCRIRQIPGIGPIVATAIVAAIGNGAAFRKGRDFAAWLGLVPRQYSTGGKAKLLGISKRGNIYLRKVLIHGARAAAMRIKRDRFPIGAWMNALEARAPRNVLVVAMANKLARIAWAVLSSGEDYRSGVNPIAA